MNGIHFYGKLPACRRPIDKQGGHVIHIQNKPAIGGPMTEVDLQREYDGVKWWSCLDQDGNERKFISTQWSPFEPKE